MYIYIYIYIYLYIYVYIFVCFTSYFVFRIAVLPHSSGVVYYDLLLRRETRIPGVAPFSLRIGIWDLFVHRGQKSYTPTALGKLWTTPGVRCMKHVSFLLKNKGHKRNTDSLPHQPPPNPVPIMTKITTYILLAANYSVHPHPIHTNCLS